MHFEEKTPMKQVEIYESPRWGTRLQIQIDGPGRVEIEHLLDLGMSELDALAEFLIHSGTGVAADKSKKGAADRPLAVHLGSQINHLLPEPIDGEEVVIVTLTESKVIAEVYAIRPIRLDPLQMLATTGRVFFTRIFQSVSEVSQEA